MCIVYCILAKIKLTGSDLQHVSVPRPQTEQSEAEQRGGNSCKDAQRENDDLKLRYRKRERKCVFVEFSE